MTAPSSSAIPPASPQPNARHAFGGIWRLTVRRLLTPMHWLVLALLIAVLVLLSLPAWPSQEAAAHHFLMWIDRMYLTFLLPIIVFINAAGVMRDELKPGNVDYVFTRPVGRPAFVVFKFLSHLACAQLDFLCVLAVVVGIGAYRHVPGLWAAVPVLLLAQVIVTTAFSALGFLSAVLTARYVIIGLLYGGIIEIGVGKIPTQINRLSMTAQIRAMLAPFTRVPGTEQLTPDAGVLATVAILLVFAVAAVAIAAAFFSWQELAGAKSSET